jgi:threonine/homoserine/homoserine lactone efflux protein
MLDSTRMLLFLTAAVLLGKKIRSSAVFRRRQRTLTGTIMIGLGTYLAASESH